MKKPEMIVFDYGNTLLCEPGYDRLRGQEALFKYIKSNPRNKTPEEVTDFAGQLYEKIESARALGLEFLEPQFLRMLYEYNEIELSISFEEAETVFWDGASLGAVMPGAGEMLDYVSSTGIRTAVISNIAYSGRALEGRINRLLPNNKFEFILASSEYMLRKPDRLLFELALKKAGLPAQAVWYCGDDLARDIHGASGAGIFPVWYDNLTVHNPWRPPCEGAHPDCEHLHIHEWRELTELLKTI